MPIRPFDPSAPAVGALIPDFSTQTFGGQCIHRRDFKGRRHLVICFAAEGDSAPLLATLATMIPAWRAERADALLILPAMSGSIDANVAAIVVADGEGALRKRFGVGANAALFIADRYGEIVCHATTATALDLPLDEVLPILEQIEMRCSL